MVSSQNFQRNFTSNNPSPDGIDKKSGPEKKKKNRVVEEQRYMVSWLPKKNGKAMRKKYWPQSVLNLASFFVSFKNAGTKFNKFSPSQNRSNFFGMAVVFSVQFLDIFGGLWKISPLPSSHRSEEPVVAGELCSKVLPWLLGGGRNPIRFGGEGHGKVNPPPEEESKGSNQFFSGADF